MRKTRTLCHANSKQVNMSCDVDVGFRIIVILTLSCGIYAKPSVSLFTDDDDVLLLNSTNFNKTIHGSSRAWFVNFYNSWCGHCVRFAPTWQELAANTTGWSSVIRVAAIDCSLDVNMRICRDYGLTGYPTLKFFPAHSNSSFLGMKYQRGDGSLLMMAMVNFITSDTDGFGPNIRHRLSPAENLEEILREKDEHVKYVVIIFADLKSYVAKQVILDLWDCQELLIRQILPETASQYGVNHFPSMYLLGSKGQLKPLANVTTDHKNFTRTLLQLTERRDGFHGDDQSEERDGGRKDTAPFDDKFIIPRAGGIVYQQDLESALHYSLRHEVAGHSTIEDEKLLALQSYITVLAKCYPGKNSSLLYLHSIDSWLQEQQGRILGITWLDQINSLESLEGFLVESDAWIGCQGSQPKYRGYPCGLWTLFHSLTVNCVLEKKLQDPKEVLLAMRSYITHLFGCKECSKNFNKGAKFIEEKVSTMSDSILFLWQSHNRANFHLHGDLTEDPEHVKVQFPPNHLCKGCHLEKDGQDIVWNETVVLKYLTNMYRKSNIFTNNGYQGNQRKNDLSKFSNKKLEKQKAAQEEIQRIYSSAAVKVNTDRAYSLRQREISSRALRSGQMNGFDLSLCLVFYVLCSAMIIMLYFYFLIKRKMKLCPYL